MSNSEQNNLFLKKTKLFKYNPDKYKIIEFHSEEDILIHHDSENVNWLNVYGLYFKKEFKELFKRNHFDSFLNLLFSDEDHRNKVIQLESNIFLSLKTIHYSDGVFDTEQMMFVASPNYVISVQEKPGDYFGHIRERIIENKGIVRKKNADYLLYLIIDAIVDNYYKAYEEMSKKLDLTKDFQNIKPDPKFALKIESSKQDLFILKKAISTLRDAISKIEKNSLPDFESHYFSELKEQANYLMDDIDFDLQQLESNLNLVFNMQSHRLNEVMKTLTVFSVIFIPLTFLAGIYGMNFKYIPELEYKYGYFILLGIMLVSTIMSIFIFKKKKWFD